MKSILSLLVAWGAAAVPARAGQDAPDARLLLLAARSHLDNLNSLELASVATTRHGGNAEAKADDNDAKRKFVVDGNKYRTESRVTQHPQGQLIWDRVVVFDGEQYFYYSGALRILEKTSRIPDKDPYLGFQPVLVPFMFVCGENVPADLGSMAAVATWERLFKHAKVVGREEVGGHPCDIVEIQRVAFGQQLSFRIWLAADAGSYPIQYVVTDPSKRSSRVSVQGLLAHGSRQAPVQVPTRIETKDFEPNGDLKVTVNYTVDSKSIKVNEPVAPDSFVPPKANMVVDADTGKVTRAALDVSPRRWSSWWFRLAALAVCVVGAMWLRWWWVSKRSKAPE